jgi:hypothetical protein
MLAEEQIAGRIKSGWAFFQIKDLDERAFACVFCVANLTSSQIRLIYLYG